MKFLNKINLMRTASLDFTTSTEETRNLYWDDDNGTLSLEMGNGILQQIGLEQYTNVKNLTVSTIPNGTVVMLNGATGAAGRMTIAPAIGDGSIQAHCILGLTTQEITSGADGLTTTFGDAAGVQITAAIANKVSAIIGDGTNTAFVITHGLKTKDLIVSLRDIITPF